ncbi:hypothetical protein L3Q82_024636, partial [Scortum barcoo]
MDVFSPDTCGRRGVRPLLLVCLFVLKASADCPKPHGGENTVLTNEALLLNDFPEGSVASLECANGYLEESGSGRMTCIDGAWTMPDLTCKKKDCGPPKAQPNMIFNTSSGTLFGAVIEVLCETGYQLSGVSYKQCYVTGWSGRSRCELVTCNKPHEVTNGRNSWNSSDYPPYGETIRYTCEEGYVLIGKDTITCSETGEYDSHPPECKSKLPLYASTSTGSPGTPTAHRDKTFTTSKTTTPDNHGMDTDTTEHTGYTPVIIAVICVLLVFCIFIVCLYKFLLRRK